MKYSPSRYRVYGGMELYKRCLEEFLWFKWLGGDDVGELEKRFAAITGAKYAVAVPMARVGIYLSLQYLAKAGQFVLMSPYTIADVVNMVVAAGMIPCFVDVDSKSGNICPEKLVGKLTHLKENYKLDTVGAILVTHLHGVTVDMEKIVTVATQFELPILEDTAQALGAKKNNKFYGTFGQAGVYSFGAYKNINSLFGGMIVTDDSKLAKDLKNRVNSWGLFSLKRLAKKFINISIIDFLGWGPIFKYFMHHFFRFGALRNIEWINRIVKIELDTSLVKELPQWYQSRMTPGQARLILSQLNKLESDAHHRLQISKCYETSIVRCSGVVFPPLVDELENVFTYYPLQIYNREELLKWFQYFHRDVAAQHLKNCAHLDSFKNYYSLCPVAEKVAQQVVLLPTYPGYDLEEAEINVKVVNWFLLAGQPQFSFENAKNLGVSPHFFSYQVEDCLNM